MAVTYIYIMEDCFEKQSSEKDLGVIIDNRLNVSCLGDAVAKKTNEILECREKEKQIL